MKKQIHSKDKGSLGEISVAKALIRRGLPVFVEYGDNSKIDIITQKKDRLVTIQVKARAVESGSIMVRTLRSGPNYRYNYQIDDFDLYAIYCMETDDIYYVPLELVVQNGGSINLRIKDLKTSHTKNVRYASDYLSLNKAIKYLSSSNNYKHYLYRTSDKILKPLPRYTLKRNFMSKEIALQMQEMKNNNTPIKDIAVKFKVARKTVSKTIKKFLKSG